MRTSSKPWYRLLSGTTQLVWRSAPVELGGRQHRQLLTALALRPGDVVTVARLIELIWGDDPPRSAGKSIQVLVSHLRRALPADAGAIGTDAGGYRLDVDADRVDLHRFRRLVAQARGPADAHQRTTILCEAVSLVGAEPLADLAGTGPGDRLRDSVTEECLSARERYLESQLDAGRSHELVPELVELVAAYPLREALAGLLMRTLRAAGRSAEALAVYAGTRAVLADQLGTEPGPELRRLHAELLAEPDQPDAPPPVVPRQLPATVPHFAGRADELKTLTELLDRDSDRGTTATIAVICGNAGIGKTTLAVCWAHQVADRFPDGQAYVNLRGFGPPGTPATPDEAIRALLDAVQVAPERIPTGLDAQTGLYRSLTAGKRMLIVLDNATDEQQVRPLLPGASSCLTLVTSRNQLAGLAATHGARLLPLDRLGSAEAHDMLVRHLGGQRVDSEAGSAAELIALCARLPLALAVIAARAAARPEHPLATFATQLRHARSRLDALETGEAATDIRTVFSWSYQSLTPAAARMFRFLGGQHGPNITAAAAANLAATRLPEASSAIAELVRASLLIEHPPGRYAMHDLLRDYAAELCEVETSHAERTAALRRLATWYLVGADAARQVLSPMLSAPVPRPGARLWTPVPTFDGHHAVLRWYDDEHANLLATIRQAADSGLHQLAWQLPAMLWPCFEVRKHWRTWIPIFQTAARSAGLGADPHGEAWMLNGLGIAYREVGQYDDASSHLERALALRRRIGDRRGQAMTLNNVAITIAQRSGDHDQALKLLHQALAIGRELADNHVQAVTLGNLGEAYRLAGQLDEATRYLRYGLDRYREMGYLTSQATALHNLGETYQGLGRAADAAEYYREALAIRREVGNRMGEASTLTGLGEALIDLGRPAEARKSWQDALAIYRSVGAPHATALAARLADIRSRTAG